MTIFVIYLTSSQREKNHHVLTTQREIIKFDACKYNKL